MSAFQQKILHSKKQPVLVLLTGTTEKGTQQLGSPIIRICIEISFFEYLKWVFTTLPVESLNILILFLKIRLPSVVSLYLLKHTNIPFLDTSFLSQGKGHHHQ